MRCSFPLTTSPAPSQYHNWPVTSGVGQGRSVAWGQAQPGEQDAVKPPTPAPLSLQQCSPKMTFWLFLCEHQLLMAYYRSFSQTLSGKRCGCWVGEFWGSNSLHIPGLIIIMLNILFLELEAFLATSSFDYLAATPMLPCLARNRRYHLRWPFMCVISFHSGNNPGEIYIMIISILQRRNLRFRQVH